MSIPMFYEKQLGANDFNMPVDWYKCPWFTTNINPPWPALVTFSGKLSCRYKGADPEVGAMITYRLAMDGGNLFPGIGCNIRDQQDHYGIIPIAWTQQVPAGPHTFELFVRSARQVANPNGGAPGVIGSLAELKSGQCFMFVRVEPQDYDLIYQRV